MTASTIEFGRKAVILFVLAGVAVIFASSFAYRMSNPNLYKEVRQQRAADDHDHGDEPAGPPPGMGGQAMGGNMGQIREFMARVEKDPNDVKALVGLGNSFLMMRAWDRALEPLEKANSLEPGNVNLLKALGIAHFNMEQFDKAAAAYDEILTIAPEDTLALFNLGVINKYYFEKTDKARTYFEKILEVEKDDADMIKMAKQELEK